MNGHILSTSKRFKFLAGSVIGLTLLNPAFAEDLSSTSPSPTADVQASGESASNDLMNLLPVLLTSQERKQFAEQLEAAIRQGDLNGAENSLNMTIELGTLAVILSNNLRNPNLLPALHALGIQGGSTPSPTPSEEAIAPESCSVPAAPVLSNAAELENRLRQEEERSGNALRQLSDMEKELHALRASTDEAMASKSARVAQLEKALAQTQIQSEMLLEELTRAQEELRTVQATYQPSPMPLVTRIAGTGTDVPLPQSKTGDELQAAPLFKPSAMNPSSASGEPGAQDITSAPHQNEPAPVMIAALPDHVQPLPIASEPPAETKVSADAKVEVVAPADTSAAEDRLTTRAEELLRSGDVSAARLILQRSLESGSARAAFLMAETFDPNVLAKLRVLGIRGDASRAQELYARARSLGMTQAGERLEALK